ncbi:hypothetical protein [Azospirillum sp. TSO35-2]|uniref:hypothetical protein n=1 Tax=Azospirillum sp. TSO35-2 TaxID=716796 RepID=UPI0011B5D8A5|nr:hypothetical protein [Azospirillum sp. TSO35-2]
MIDTAEKDRSAPNTFDFETSADGGFGFRGLWTTTRVQHRNDCGQGRAMLSDLAAARLRPICGKLSSDG